MNKFNEWLEKRNEDFSSTPQNPNPQVQQQVGMGQPQAEMGDVRFLINKIAQKLGGNVQEFMPLIKVVNSRGMLPLLVKLIDSAGQLRAPMVGGMMDKMNARIQ